MKKGRIIIFLFTLVSMMGTVSCSEEDNTVEEFPNWQVRNDDYFNHLSDSVKELIALNPARTDWKRIKCWSKSDSVVGSNADYIIVNVKRDGDASGATPLYTDTDSVHYMGWLLPSTSYPSGYVFDKSYSGNFYEDISRPSEFAIGNSSGNKIVDGFATALQSMRRGDRWIVYIPYQLGYSSSATTRVPAFSTLIFDLTLVDFWSPVTTE